MEKAYHFSFVLLPIPTLFFCINPTTTDSMLIKSYWIKDFQMSYGFTTFTARKTIFYFSKYSKTIVFSKNIALEYDLSCIIRREGFFSPENMILFFRQKMKDHLSQKIQRSMIFSVYSVKIVSLFPSNMILTSCQESKDDQLPKNKKYLKMTFQVSLKS